MGKTNKNEVKGTFIVLNDRGLHTRPSTEIVKAMSNYKSSVFLVHHKQRVNAKSLLGILMLAAPKGAKISVMASGDDAERALEALQKLAMNNFNIEY